MNLPVCTVNTNNIQNLPDTPTLSSQELKQEFDKSGKDFKDYINEILLPAVEKLVKDEKTNLEDSINNKILEDNKKKYHIGKIVMSTSDTNPNKYLGFGTWVLWGSGKVPVGVDTANPNFNTVEKSGGEEKHTLTIPEMPKHSHQMNCIALASNPGPISTPSISTPTYQAPTSEVGEGKPHNNLQPYITCYMWKRTA